MKKKKKKTHSNVTTTTETCIRTFTVLNTHIHGVGALDYSPHSSQDGKPKGQREGRGVATGSTWQNGTKLRSGWQPGLPDTGWLPRAPKTHIHLEPQKRALFGNWVPAGAGCS